MVDPVSWSVICCASLLGINLSDLDLYNNQQIGPNYAQSFGVVQFLEAMFFQAREILMEPAKTATQSPTRIPRRHRGIM
jgi:hypothetical protein